MKFVDDLRLHWNGSKQGAFNAGAFLEDLDIGLHGVDLRVPLAERSRQISCANRA
ncbi:hypothetical protein JQ594_17245 [Bradyrhizobium manausense]|uniref:hypothetical protein n=1 Tax=Bradyrhizobium manausense TaxID=989370 RepID=UPI001BA5686C|nr:hypothetical protein [Bradyrhizobium manausense]MBR0687681.1 hypothetical protein [Bradyrhizobium manausense]